MRPPGAFWDITSTYTVGKRKAGSYPDTSELQSAVANCNLFGAAGFLLTSIYSFFKLPTLTNDVQNTFGYLAGAFLYSVSSAILFKACYIVFKESHEHLSNVLY